MAFAENVLRERGAAVPLNFVPTARGYDPGDPQMQRVRPRRWSPLRCLPVPSLCFMRKAMLLSRECLHLAMITEQI